MKYLFLVFIIFLSGCNGCGSDSPEDLEKLKELNRQLDSVANDSKKAGHTGQTPLKASTVEKNTPPPLEEGIEKEEESTFTYSSFYDANAKNKKYDTSLGISVEGEVIMISRDGQPPVAYSFERKGEWYLLKKKSKEWNTPLFRTELKLKFNKNCATFNDGKTTRVYE